MTRRAQILITIVFLVVIAVPGLLMVAGMRPKNIENRATTAFPELESGSIVDETYYRSVASYLTDRLPLRDRAIQANTDIDDAIALTEPFSPDQARGSDGWLYHPETLLDDCPGPKPARFFERGERIAAKVERADIPFLYLVAPDKEAVYPEHLPIEGVAGLLGLSGDEAPDCSRTWDVAIAEAAPEEPWLDPLTDDLRADKAASDTQLYYKRDTHWTDPAAINLVEVMVEHVAPGMFDPAQVKPTVPDVKQGGDLAILRGDERVPEEVPGLVVERPGVTVEYTRAPPGTEGQNVDISRATSTDSPLIEGTTVLLGDSFGRHTMELLGPYFEELVWVSRDYLLNENSGGLASVTDEPPTAVFVQQVQRNVMKGWYQTFIQAINQYLEQG